MRIICRIKAVPEVIVRSNVMDILSVKWIDCRKRNLRHAQIRHLQVANASYFWYVSHGLDRY